MELLLFPYRGIMNTSLLKDFSSHGKNLNILKQLKQNKMKIEINIKAESSSDEKIDIEYDIENNDMSIYDVLNILETIKRQYYEEYKKTMGNENILELSN